MTSLYPISVIVDNVKKEREMVKFCLHQKVHDIAKKGKKGEKERNSLKQQG